MNILTQCASAGSIVCALLFASYAAPAGAQDLAAGQRKHGYCATCHGIEGQSFKPNYPVLAGQPASYLLEQLARFKDGRRRDPNMDAVAPQLSTQDMRDLAAFFASIRPRPEHFKPDAKKAARGRALAKGAGCTGCHPRSLQPAGSPFPRIAAQQRNYLVKQLRNFRDGRRSTDAGVMRRIVQALSDTQIDDLAEYFASLR